MTHTIRRRNTHRSRHRREHSPRPVRPTPARPVVTKDERNALVTDHAVLRWIERVTGIDVASQVRAEILADGRDVLIPSIGKGSLCINDGAVVLKIKCGRVVTVVNRGYDP